MVYQYSYFVGKIIEIVYFVRKKKINNDLKGFKV